MASSIPLDLGEKMLKVLACKEKQRVLETQEAPGKCPHCGGSVKATIIEAERSLCFCLTLCHQNKRKFICSLCSRPLHCLLP